MPLLCLFCPRFDVLLLNTRCGVKVIGDRAEDEGSQSSNRKEQRRPLEPESIGRELEAAGLGVSDGEEQTEGTSSSFLRVESAIVLVDEKMFPSPCPLGI